jgi:hypothetical protein
MKNRYFRKNLGLLACWFRSLFQSESQRDYLRWKNFISSGIN